MYILKIGYRNGTTVPLGTGRILNFKEIFVILIVNYSSDFIFQSTNSDLHTDSQKLYWGNVKNYINLIETIVNVLITIDLVNQKISSTNKKILKNILYVETDL